MGYTFLRCFDWRTINRKNSDEPLNDVNLVIYQDNGAKIRFNNLRRALIKGISEQEMTILKDTLKEMDSMNIESLNSAKDVTEFVNLLKYKKVFTDRDVITLQYLMRVIERQDLEKKCIDYATSRKERLCYFQEENHTETRNVELMHAAKDGKVLCLLVVPETPVIVVPYFHFRKSIYI